MRTVPFQTLYHGVVRRLGLDPLVDIGQDVARAIVQCINERVDLIWPLLPIPELTVTKEVGFREVWQPTKQYNLGDEIIFHFDKAYYIATGQPPLGASPAVSAIWHPLEKVEPYIELDFVTPVFGIYGSDPSANGCGNGLSFQPSEHGVRVLSSHGATVWIWAMIPTPQYTIVPWDFTKAYLPGDLIYVDARPRTTAYGRVYTCIAENTGLLDAAHWNESVVPRVLLNYLLAGATADCLRSGKPDQLKIASAAVQDAEADRRYQALVDWMGIQGYKPRMLWPARPGCNGVGQPWLGDRTIPMTVNLVGAAPESPMAPIGGVSWEYNSTIQYLRTADGLPSLSGVGTTMKEVKSLIEIVIDGQRMTFQLVVGAADPGDPGQVAPDDYASVSNNKHWERVSG